MPTAAQKQQANNNQPPRPIPEVLEAEQGVLGCILMNNEIYYSVSTLLEPYHFFEPLHQMVFEAIQELVLRGTTAHPVTIRNQIQFTGTVDGMTVSQYLARLVSEAVAPMVVPAQAAAIVEAYNRRRIISIGEGLVELGYEEGNPAVLAEATAQTQSDLGEVCAVIEGNSEMSGTTLADAYLEAITRQPGTKSKHGVPIALKEIETVLSERMFEAHNLYGLISSSGEGKTSITLQIIYAALIKGHPVQFFSFDQTATQIVSQLVAQNLGYEVRHQKGGDLTDKQVDQAYAFARDLAAMPFEVVDCNSVRDTVSKMSAKAKRFVKRKGNGKSPLFVFDHMSAIPPDYEYRSSDEGTKAITKGNALKALAKSLNGVSLVLQQRSGSGMKRFNPRPIPSDLYGGEAARQPFDAIFYLFRAEEHMRRQIDTAKDQKEEDQIRERFERMFPREYGIEGTAEIGTLKVRFGKIGIKRYLNFIGEYTKYESTYRAVNEGQEGLDL